MRSSFTVTLAALVLTFVARPIQSQAPLRTSLGGHRDGAGYIILVW